MYKNVIKHNILESAENNKPSLSDIEKAYEPLEQKLNTAENGKRLLWEITKNFDDDKLGAFIASITGKDAVSNYLIANILNSKKSTHDKLWDFMLDYFYTPGKWEDRTLISNHVKDLYTKVFPYINSQEIADNIKKALETDIDIPVYTQIGKSKDTKNTDNKTLSVKNGKSDGKPKEGEKEGGGTVSSANGETETNPTSAASGGSGTVTTNNEPQADGNKENKQEEKKPDEKAKKDVEIPNISIDVVKAYRKDLDDRVNTLKNNRERILRILQIQSEMIDQLKNPQSSQQGQQGQQMYDGRDWTPTTVPTYQQGQQGDAHHQQAPQQSAPKKDEDEGFLSKAWNGIKKAGSGVLDVASAPLGAVKDGIDGISNWLSNE